MTESELILTDILNCNRASLYLNKDRRLGKRESALLSSILKRRVKREPIQYILGKTEFMGLEFRLTEDVFIPRPETEILVETAIKFSCQLSDVSCRLKILDIATGSGCIAVSLVKFLKRVDVCATDVSKEALEIAKQNALLNNVKINFLQGNLFPSYGPWTKDYGLIVSNPPYIPTAEISHLEPELSFEPRIAQDGGRDGLDFYRRIIRKSSAYLRKGGFLIMEMGFNQYPAIKELFYSDGKFDIIEVGKDYQGIDRVIATQLRKPVAGE